MTSPAVSVIIPARDAEQTLERSLLAVRDQTLDERFEVIVVDDGSRDRTAEIARSHGSFVHLVSNPESLGPGAARNRGARAATGRILAFTDADCFPTPGWLAAGLRLIHQADLVQGGVQPDPAAPRAPFDRTLVVERDGGFYQTANLFVRRETFNAVGGFRDWVLEERAGRRQSGARRTPIGEDTLFGWAARRLGARSCFAPDALVHHAVVPGNVIDGMADRWHWARDMAGLVRLVPELRETTFYRRLFFNHVSAYFDLALAGVLATAVSGRAKWMLASRPYVRHVLGYSRRWDAGERASYLLGAPIVELVTLAGLLTGSVRWRSLIL